MKILVTILCITGMLYPALSQQTTIPITARDCYEAVQTAVKTELSSPELKQVATGKGKVEVIGDISPNVINGKSNLWIYGYRASNGEARAIVVFKSALNQQCLAFAPAEQDTAKVPHFTIASNWINSDSVNKYLLRNSLYQLFRAQYPEGQPELWWCVGADEFGDDGNPFPVESTVWITIFPVDAVTKLICGFALNSNTDTYCASQVTAVEDNTLENTHPSVFPNPAHDFAIVQLPEHVVAMVQTAVLFDVHGEQVKNLTGYVSNAQSGTIAIPVHHIPSGVYSLRLVTPTKVFTIPFVIEH
ncbi:MAG: T9SS type A sorting domain-containing protein [Candidatus Kapabacteria bacterium]|nr:T9SS type A sorting domain-containing protein [Candidatus Kapabacteria bacterium]MBX7156068.1 T9SS type A sorting domain-containing protein [Bacteroidota bacterium]